MASNIEIEDSALGNNERFNRRLNESHWEHVHMILIFIRVILIRIFRVYWSCFASLFSCFNGLLFTHYIAVPVLLLSAGILTAAVITLSGLVRLIYVIYCLSFFACSVVSLCCKQGAIMFINVYQQVDQQEDEIDPRDFQEVEQPTRDSPKDEKVLLHKALRNLLEPIPENTILETKIKPEARRKLQTSHDFHHANSCTPSNYKEFGAAGPSNAPDPFPPLNLDDNSNTTAFPTTDSYSPRARSGTYNISGEDETHFSTSRHFDADGYDSYDSSQPLSEVRSVEDAVRKFISYVQARLILHRKPQPSHSNDYNTAGPSHAPDPFPPSNYDYNDFVELSEVPDASPSLNQDDNNATSAFHIPDSSSLSAHDRTYIIPSEDVTDLLQSTHFDAKGCDAHEIPQRLSQARLSAEAIRAFGPPAHVLGANSYRISYSSDENCFSDEQALSSDSSDAGVGGNTFEVFAQVHHSDSHRPLSSNNDGSSSVELESILTDESARGVITDSYCNLPYVDGSQSSESPNSQ